MSRSAESSPIAWKPLAFAVVAALAATFALTHGESRAAEAAVTIPAPAVDEPASSSGTETTVLAGGCFWGVQGVFQHVKGVTKAVSGYAGGEAKTAQYEEVSSGETGHAESVQVTFDPKQITYGQILQIYFSVAHDPTQLNRQGPDRGTQYRSAVFPTNAAQEKVVTDYIAQLNEAGVYSSPLVTRIETSKTFYPAEGYHQDYLAHNPRDGYIVYNDLPKVERLKQMFPERYRDPPVLVGTSIR
jgi:peptide-methionine (S)-S-oxide reductase